MKFFKQITLNHHVVMGRKTFEALGKPLSNRTNIVITRNDELNTPGCVMVKDLKHALDYAKQNGELECMVIGGGNIYLQSMLWADRIYLTRVHHEFVADTFFPKLEEGEWKLVSEEKHQADEKHAHAFDFQVWERMSN